MPARREASNRPDKKPVNQHDRFCRLCLMEPKKAGLLFSAQLPKWLMCKFAPGLPELVPGSFVDDQMEDARTDRSVTGDIFKRFPCTGVVRGNKSNSGCAPRTAADCPDCGLSWCAAVECALAVP